VREPGRAIGLDVHRDFCEVAICEEGKVRSAGRVDSSPEAVEVLAASLGPDDRVALEVTGGAWAIAGILEPHVAGVVVVSPGDTGIAQARAKTDRLDARTLARLLWAGELDGVWAPDELTRLLRRRLARREQLVRARSRAKNEIHAVLMRCLVGKPPVSDLFGVAGRKWLRRLELPVEECETVEACMRHIEFLDTEIAEVERVVARYALSCSDARRLMSVPGVNVICAATFLAAVGDIRRFRTSRQLVGYLGLDPRVRQSGSSRARSGRISKRGSGSVRWALVEAAASVIRQPGPMRAYYQRLRARRGHQIAVVAVARKLAVLFWCLLTREEQYAHQQPSLTAKKLRLLEIRGGAPTRKGSPTGTWATREKMREAEQALALQAEASYVRAVRDWQAAAPKKKAGAGVTPGRA
jgi:transposase